MADHTLHDLTPAYALDALDVDEREAYERHLATCERCRAELETMQGTASALAYAVRSPAPPAELRERIVGQARLERGDVVPLRPRRRLTYALGATAAVAACAAALIGLWAISLSSQLDRERSALEILADPGSRSVAMEGGNGRLTVTERGEAALVVSGLGPAPEGRTYEIWVIADDRALPAGLFEGSGTRDIVRLSRPVPPGAVVAVTIERAGGAQAPTSEPLMSTRA
jgi:anti-sigma-K factor RskA